MEDLSNIALAQTAGTLPSDGFMALLLVQSVGVLLAGLLTFSLHNIYGNNFSDSWILYIRVVVGCVAGLTLGVACFQAEFLSQIWSWFDFIPPHPKGGIGVTQALCIYFIADFAALAVLIYATGGSEQSLFSTFLFVLVPITIALGRKPGWEIVVLFAGFTIAIFLVLLWVHSTLDPGSGVSGKSRRNWFGTITTMCVIFPTIVYCGQNRGEPRATSGGDGTNAMHIPDPSGAESNALAVRDGVVDWTDPVAADGEHGVEWRAVPSERFRADEVQGYR